MHTSNATCSLSDCRGDVSPKAAGQEMRDHAGVHKLLQVARLSARSTQTEGAANGGTGV